LGLAGEASSPSSTVFDPRHSPSSAAGIQTIRSRIREISIDAEARHSDGSPLVLLPHDCRRVFASEHLNNNTPVHVIQALLGHASPDTVMIYAKLYPGQLIEEYRKTVRSLCNAYYGEDGLKNPTAAEWAAFAASTRVRKVLTLANKPRIMASRDIAPGDISNLWLLPNRCCSSC
jgi:Phage integrase family